MSTKQRKRRTSDRRGYARGERLPPIVRKIVTLPLDIDKFVYVFGVFVAAAVRKMPMSVRTTPLTCGDGTQVRLTDVPIHRGIVAAYRELKSMNVDELAQQAYVWRIMSTSELYRHVSALTDFLKQSNDGMVLTLSEALIKALAVVSYDVDQHSAAINISDLVVSAQRFSKADSPAFVGD